MMGTGPENQLWERLGDWFYSDKPETLPDINVQPLTDQEMIDIYEWILSLSGIYDHPTTWSLSEERDILLEEIEYPARKLIEKEISYVRHGLTSIAIDGIEIPQLTIAMLNPGRITFDYQIGPDWGPEQLAALLEFLKRIKQIAPIAGFTLIGEGGWPTCEIFDDVLNEYARYTS